ncbi:MAG: LCP family protein [Sporolactobacillus sp.]|nr:LCP family protein [Sporolactobacillus sp.]
MSAEVPGTFSHRAAQRKRELAPYQYYAKPPQPTKKRRRRPRRPKRIVMLLILLVLIGGSFGFYKWNAYKPDNHFRNLDAIGAKQSAQKSGTFNALLIGSDARKGQHVSHTDTILLVHADLNRHRYNVLSIPRDTRVMLDGYGYTKLTSVQYVSQLKSGTKQGTLDAVKAVSQLTGVPINYYAETDYKGMQNLVDAVGGITMKLPFDVTLTHAWYRENQGKTFKAGTYQLNGRMVTEITRERYSLPGTDFGRQKLQQAALLGIARKAMDAKNVAKLPALIRSASKFLVATNMKTDDMISIGVALKNNFHPAKQIIYHQVKGESTKMYDDVLQAANYEIILDRQQLKTIIANYFKESE